LLLLLLRMLLLLVMLLLLLLVLSLLLLLQVSSFVMQNLSGGWRRFGEVANQLALACFALKIVDNIKI
jgi:ABC-type sulfate transport system permease component